MTASKLRSTTKAKHSPGPWTLDPLEVADADAFDVGMNGIYSADGYEVAEVVQPVFTLKRTRRCKMRTRPKAEAMANALLICEAPAMHRLLRLALAGGWNARREREAGEILKRIKGA